MQKSWRAVRLVGETVRRFTVVVSGPRGSDGAEGTWAVRGISSGAEADGNGGMGWGWKTYQR